MKRRSNEAAAGAVNPPLALKARNFAGVLIAAVLALFCAWTPASKAETLLTLEEALARAVLHHPSVWEADASARQAHLEFERSHEAGRRLQASVNAQLGGFRWSSGEDGLKFTSSFTSDSPITLSTNWQLAPGTSLSGTFRTLQDDNRVATLSLNRQIWPSPVHSGSEIARLNALEALEEVPGQQERARVAALIDVYARYRQLQIEEARAELLAQSVAAKEEQHALTAARRERGLASEEELIQAALDLDKARADLERAQRNLSLTKQAFARDLGLSRGDFRLEPLPEAMAVPEIDLVLEEAIDAALAESPDVRAAERNVRAAERRYEAARKATPFSVDFTANLTMREWDESPTAAAYLVGTYDLADGGSRRIEREEAKLALERAERALETAREGVKSDVARRLSELEWLRKQIEFAETSLSLARRTYEARLEQARLGVATEAAVEESRRAAEEAHLSYVEAVVSYEAARLELWHMLGREIQIEGKIGYPSP